MAESPDLASANHRKLKEAYDTDDKFENIEVPRQSKDHFGKLLDEVEVKLGETSYIPSRARVQPLNPIACESPLSKTTINFLVQEFSSPYWFITQTAQQSHDSPRSRPFSYQIIEISSPHELTVKSKGDTCTSSRGKPISLNVSSLKSNTNRLFEKTPPLLLR